MAMPTANCQLPTAFADCRLLLATGNTYSTYMLQANSYASLAETIQLLLQLPCNHKMWKTCKTWNVKTFNAPKCRQSKYDNFCDLNAWLLAFFLSLPSIFFYKGKRRIYLASQQTDVVNCRLQSHWLSLVALSSSQRLYVSRPFFGGSTDL